MSSPAKRNSESITSREAPYVAIILSYVKKRETLQKAIDKDSDGGLVSGPFTEPELRGKYNKVLLNSLGADQRSRKTGRRNFGRRNPRGRQPKDSSNNASNKTDSCGRPKDLGCSRNACRCQMERGVCPPSCTNSRIGTRTRLDNGPQRTILCEQVGTSGWPKLSQTGAV